MSVQWLWRKTLRTVTSETESPRSRRHVAVDRGDSWHSEQQSFSLAFFLFGIQVDDLRQSAVRCSHSAEIHTGRAGLKCHLMFLSHLPKEKGDIGTCYELRRKKGSHRTSEGFFRYRWIRYPHTLWMRCDAMPCEQASTCPLLGTGHSRFFALHSKFDVVHTRRETVAKIRRLSICSYDRLLFFRSGTRLLG